MSSLGCGFTVVGMKYHKKLPYCVCTDKYISKITHVSMSILPQNGIVLFVCFGLVSVVFESLSPATVDCGT